MNLLFGMKDIGGANAVIPVACKATEENDFRALLYCDGVSYERFNGAYPVISSKCDPGQVIDWLKPNAVITTTCSPEGNLVVPVNFVKAVRSKGVPVVAVQDFWGSGMSVKWDVWPDKMCVQDNLAKNLLLSSWKEYNPDDVVVTGQPAFDYLGQIDCNAAQSKLREKLQLYENWPIIHLSGGFKGTAEAVEWTVKALNKLQWPVYLIVRYHPRMTRAEAPPDWKEIYEKCRDLPSQLKYGQVVDSSSLSSSEVNTGADVIIGIYSTLLVEGCYLRKDCISIVTPEAKAYFEMETANMLSEFPPSTLSACYSVENLTGLVNVLGRIRQYRHFLLIHQNRHFVSDGQSAQRVLGVINSVRI